MGSRAYGSATTVGTYTPGVSVPLSHYGATAVVKAFRGEKPSALVSAFDAREVLQYQGAPAQAATRPPVTHVAAPAVALPELKLATTPPATDPALSDTWSGTYAGTITGQQAGQRVTMRMSVTVIQQGHELTGTWAAEGASGTLSGSIIQPNLLTLRVTQLTPCPGEFNGAAQLAAGPKLIGSYSGSACRGDVQASFSAARQ